MISHRQAGYQDFLKREDDMKKVLSEGLAYRVAMVADKAESGKWYVHPPYYLIMDIFGRQVKENEFGNA